MCIMAVPLHGVPLFLLGMVEVLQGAEHGKGKPELGSGMADLDTGEQHLSTERQWSMKVEHRVECSTGTSSNNGE